MRTLIILAGLMLVMRNRDIEQSEERIRLIIDAVPAYISYIDSQQKYCFAFLRHLRVQTESSPQ